MLLGPEKPQSPSLGGLCWTAALLKEGVDPQLMLMEALVAFAMSVEVAGLRGDAHLFLSNQNVQT